MDLYLYSEEDFSDKEDQENDPESNGSVDPNVSISNRIIEVLLAKTEQHNRGCSLGGGVTLNQVKSVYIKGCDNTFTSNKSLNQCALARVNMFLSINNGASLGKFFDSPIDKDLNEITGLVLEDEKNVVCSSAFDILESWHPSSFFFEKAETKLLSLITSIESFLGIEGLQGGNVLMHYIQNSGLLKNFGTTLGFISNTLSMTLMTAFFVVLFLSESINFQKILNSTIFKQNHSSVKTFMKIEKDIVKFVKVKFIISLFTIDFKFLIIVEL